MIPCKTFLCGEYAVLAGGPALGLATGPGFQLTNVVKEYHPESAAGLYLKTQNFFEVAGQAPGGFGKSTAEFLYAWLKDHSPQQNHFMNAFEAYLQLYNNPKLKAMQPSGADLLIQSLGNVTWIEEDRRLSKSVSWKYPELDFLILSTGLKIETHEHIRSLDRSALRELIPQARAAVDGYFSQDAGRFLSQLASWSKSLKAMGFLHPKIGDLVETIQERLYKINPAHFLIKPCGALGADVLVMIFDSELKLEIQSEIKELGLQIVASRLDLRQGIWESSSCR